MPEVPPSPFRTDADIAHTVLFLCSPAARFVSGQVIAVDGAGSADLLKLDLATLDPGRA
jgi:NAD(P)-dependent dehydrogenase (short-subunit alcohol dehydrogenase family)